jgi:acetylornithine/succinyldiaminopimelate/putrescine aminotransferase
MATLTHDPVLGHITTFGGHPVCCAAGLAGMKALIEEKRINEVSHKAGLFKTLLKNRLIRDVRSAGLLIAVEFENFETNKKVIDRCIDNGLITDWFLFAPECMRIAPPLVISEEEIRNACEIIVRACEA